MRLFCAFRFVTFRTFLALLVLSLEAKHLHSESISQKVLTTRFSFCCPILLVWQHENVEHDRKRRTCNWLDPNQSPVFHVDWSTNGNVPARSVLTREERTWKNDTDSVSKGHRTWLFAAFGVVLSVLFGQFKKILTCLLWCWGVVSVLTSFANDLVAIKKRDQQHPKSEYRLWGKRWIHFACNSLSCCTTVTAELIAHNCVPAELYDQDASSLQLKVLKYVSLLQLWRQIWLPLQFRTLEDNRLGLLFIFAAYIRNQKSNSRAIPRWLRPQGTYLSGKAMDWAQKTLRGN